MTNKIIMFHLKTVIKQAGTVEMVVRPCPAGCPSLQQVVCLLLKTMTGYSTIGRQKRITTNN